MDIYALIESCSTSGLNAGRYSFDEQQKYITARDIISNHPWGTYGINGKGPFEWTYLVDCSSEHLENILRTQYQITSLTTLIITAILMDRKEKEKV